MLLGPLTTHSLIHLLLLGGWDFQRGKADVQKEDSQKQGKHGVGKPRSEFEKPLRKELEDNHGCGGCLVVVSGGHPDDVLLVKDQDQPGGGVQGQKQTDGEGGHSACITPGAYGRHRLYHNGGTLATTAPQDAARRNC